MVCPLLAWMVYGLQDVVLLRQMQSSSMASEVIQRVERQKLEAMLALCEVTGCRRQVLLNYFDEPLDQPCGHCDLCLEPASTWDGTEAARKALSCVYRSGQNFGVAHLVDILLGKSTEKITRFGHDQLSTWGIGKDLDQATWRSVFRQLVARGYVNVDFEGHGVLKLNNRCRSLLKGLETIELRQDRYERAKQYKEVGRLVVEDKDRELWEALRKWRRELADAQDVPAYVILNDRTLMELLHHRPSNLDELAQINGIGQHKLEKYGEAILILLTDYEVEVS